MPRVWRDKGLSPLTGPRSNSTRMSRPAWTAVILIRALARRQAPTGVVTYPPSEEYSSPCPWINTAWLGGLGLRSPHKNPLLMYSTIRFGTASKATPQGHRLYRAGVGFELAIKRSPARRLDHSATTSPTSCAAAPVSGTPAGTWPHHHVTAVAADVGLVGSVMPVMGLLPRRT